MSIVGLLIAGLLPTPTQLSAFFEQMSEGLLMGQSILCLFPPPKDIFEPWRSQTHLCMWSMINTDKPADTDAFMAGTEN